MKRNVTIAAVTAAVLIGGTAAATVAFADSDGDRDRTSTRSASTVSLADDRDDRDDRTDDASDDRSDDRAPAAAKGSGISLDQAVAAALKSVPGTVTQAELDRDDDDHDGRMVWELDIRGSDKKWHDVTVDATNGKVLKSREDDDNDDRDDHAPRSSTVTLKQAADAALKTAPGSITSIDLDDDDDDDGKGSKGNVLRWDVDIAGKDGKQHELKVDAKTAKVTVDRDDDGDDDRDGDDD
ncbi:Propeptide PepSY amd peptidase M4 [Streptomyces sp. CBMAI 2042]|uniref:PepSY domain-containing protein n=1 Tax=Streptomyces sp. CBMAI 2042 TaxID=2305222 RepID=UPI000F1AA18C|nr:PepSY domain-containing protein [Streptomyces sp. CBMAI 2042]RLV69624.1 Propeptide PepSY amd peptidase M4 [Streptomyces sp. CBMAI 2042]